MAEEEMIVDVAPVSSAQQQAVDSLRRRYTFKLVANVFSLLVGLVTQAFIPRGLGPKAYGDFSFLTGFFTEVTSFLDMGTSICFFTKLSRRPADSGLVVFYLYFSLLASVLMILFAAVALGSGSGAFFWPDQQSGCVFLAVAWGILIWFSQIFMKMSDAYGVTVSAEVARLLQKAVGLVLIVVLFAAGHLTLISFFVYNYLMLLLLIAGLWVVISRSGHTMPRNWRITRSVLLDYSREFYQFSHPLLIYALVAFLVGIFDRWLLQVYSGSVQQGFYGLSYQIGAISFLFSSAMAPLLMREFSIAFGKQDMAEMARLFRRYIPLMYAVAAFFACFMAVEAKNVVALMGGKNYGNAVLPVTIMAFYPIHQTYGQLSGSIFYATGQTTVYRNIGICFMVLGLPLTYVMIAPQSHFGLQLGATGLAVKMVVLQVFAVNVQLYLNSKYLRMPFMKYLGHQLVVVTAFSGLALLVKRILQVSIPVTLNPLVAFVVSGGSYVILVLVTAYLFPVLFGLNKKDVAEFCNTCARRLRSGGEAQYGTR